MRVIFTMISFPFVLCIVVVFTCLTAWSNENPDSSSFLHPSWCEGGIQLRRFDKNEMPYYKIRANSNVGNIGGPAYVNRSLASKVSIKARGTWEIADGEEGLPVDSGGDGPGTVGFTPNDALLETPLKAWALIGRFLLIHDCDASPMEKHGQGWFYIGSGKTIRVPQWTIPPHYQMFIQYKCNDDYPDDNAGWLDVYEEWIR